MAVLAGNTEASVRTSRVGRRLRLPAGGLRAEKHRQCDHQMYQKCLSQGCPNPTERGFPTQETEASAKVSKVVRKSSNPMPSKLIHLGIVVEGYTSTCRWAESVMGIFTTLPLQKKAGSARKCNFFSDPRIFSSLMYVKPRKCPRIWTFRGRGHLSASA